MYQGGAAESRHSPYLCVYWMCCVRILFILFVNLMYVTIRVLISIDEFNILDYFHYAMWQIPSFLILHVIDDIVFFGMIWFIVGKLILALQVFADLLLVFAISTKRRIVHAAVQQKKGLRVLRNRNGCGEECLNQVNVLDKIARSNNGHVNHVNSGISTNS